ncbi:MAG TPA: hypothetical protein VFU92_06230 [Usitatibacter sp.]|nr:hypothetical protein [Usitatibacter sp.]
MTAALRLALACGLAGAASLAFAADEDRDEWRFELKRQNTGRGTESESTRTTLRLEYFPEAGFFSHFRLDVPLPDARTDFSGDPLDPRLGDIKVRASARRIAAGDGSLLPYVELTFPTADPAELGSGKYQLGLNLSGSVPWQDPPFAPGAHRIVVGGVLGQVVSFAGDAARNDINYTKTELWLRDSWGEGHVAKVTLKPNIDWVQDGKTGAVIEVEGSTGIGGGWRVTLMGGHLAWGSGVQGTYGKRIELTLSTSF